MTAAIVQARIASTRLPGKVLMPVCGYPLLWHVVQRLRQSRLTDTVIVATSANAPDDAIAAFCEEERIPLFRGSEHDVLDRYYHAAKAIGADVIVRVTADCPMLDPRIVDRVIGSFFAKHCDFASNTLEPSYPDGLDASVFSFGALEIAWREARLMSEREHVTPYIRKRSDLFKLCSVVHDADLSHLRWTVDEPRDLEFVREIYALLYKPGVFFFMDDILALLKLKPELGEQNRAIKRNEGYLRSLREDRVLSFPEDADADRGQDD